MSAGVDTGDAEDGDRWERFARENREWLQDQAQSDTPAAWVARAILEETDVDDG